MPRRSDCAHPAEPIHPGTLLIDSVLPSLDSNISQAARDLGVSRQALHRLRSKNAPVSPDLALRLETYTGTAAEVWLLLQVTHDLWKARSNQREVYMRAP